MHKTANECDLCNCNDHADSCSFNQDLYEQNGMSNGGICDNCAHNTQGYNCEQCIDGYYRDMNYNLQHPKACRACTCNSDGSIHGNVCDKENSSTTVAGYCRCKKNVAGESCDRCKPGFYNLDPNNPEGCSPCNCAKLGTQKSEIGDTCDAVTGLCYCKENVRGRYCDECKDEFWGLDKDLMGCKPCECIKGASVGNVCDKTTGQCGCLDNLQGRQCDKVADQHFVPGLDHFCYEAEEATGSTDTDKLIESIEIDAIAKNLDLLDDDDYYSDNTEFISEQDLDNVLEEIVGSGGGTIVGESMVDRKWTGDGFMKVKSNSSLTFEPISVTKTQDYCLAIRYRIIESDGYEPLPVQVNVQISDTTDPDDIGLTQLASAANSSCYNTSPGDRDINLELNPYENHQKVCHKNLCLDRHRTYSAYLQFSGHASVDSLVVVPEVQDDRPVDYSPDPGLVESGYDNYDDDFNGEYRHFDDSTESFVTNNVYAKCVDEVIALPKNITKQCQEVLFGVTTNFFSGAKPCDCNLQGSLSQNCQKTGGQCVCRQNVIGRTCNRCAPYTYGFSGGSDGCEECKCNLEGTVYNTMCDRSTGQCRCRQGVTGRTCDMCKPGHYSFPDCYPCECNGHADQCDQNTGICQDCSDYTEGNQCERCITGYYGDATSTYCRECMCPEGPNSSRQFASTCSLSNMFEEDHVEVCHCNEGYTGAKCDQCAPGFYGYPDQEGGRCTRCECNGNIDMIEGACDSRTGQCLKCNRNTAGANCEKCLHGYFPDGTGGCIPCGCSFEGSNPDQCVDGICGCDQDTGKCDCLDTVDGDYCDMCKPQFYGLVASIGCSPCNCDPEQSIIPNCHEVSINSNILSFLQNSFSTSIFYFYLSLSTLYL